MSDQEEEFDLDLLCDVVELEGYKDGKKRRGSDYEQGYGHQAQANRKIKA